MPSFASSRTASTRPKVPLPALRDTSRGAFSKTSSRVTLEPLTRLAKLSFRQRASMTRLFDSLRVPASAGRRNVLSTWRPSHLIHTATPMISATETPGPAS